MSECPRGEWARFEERADQLECLRRTVFHRRVTAALDRLLAAGPPGPALELGCGPGALLLAWKRRGRWAVGLDGARAMARLARANSGLPALLADASRLPFASGKLALAAGMFHFQLMPDPQASLKEIGRVLRPGGMIGLAIQHPRWSEDEARCLARGTEEDPRAEEWLAACAQRSPGSARYTPLELEDLLAAAGFRSVRTAELMSSAVILVAAVKPGPGSPGIG